MENQIRDRTEQRQRRRLHPIDAVMFGWLFGAALLLTLLTLGLNTAS